MRRTPFRPVQLAAGVFVALAVATLGVSAVLTVWETRRLASSHEQLARMHDVELGHIELERTLVRGLSQTWLADDPRWFALRSKLEELIALRAHLDADSPRRLSELRRRFDAPPSADRRRQLEEALALLREITLAEDAQQEQVLAGIERRQALQLRLELLAPALLLALAIALFALVRRRIVAPIEDLGELLGRLAEGRFEPSGRTGVDPLVRPLFERFDALAVRLAGLEAAERSHRAELEGRVRAATRELLEQRGRLARAETLAATGELAAMLAHEIRNPLASIQMALDNLRGELQDADQTARIDLVAAEARRLARLLSELLDSARGSEEAPRRVELRAVAEGTAALVRCQTPEPVCIATRVAPELFARVPEDRLRQALLNLCLNAAQALPAAGGEILIEAERRGDELRLAVSDDGPGFPEPLLAGGIRPFRSTRRHGSGLGLAVVQRFARDVGGRLELENREPRGARATLVLPVDPGRA